MASDGSQPISLNGRLVGFNVRALHTGQL
eukprot:SAG31_NODE_27647_length_422_cov_1.287926_1_plen_28_part_01